MDSLDLIPDLICAATEQTKLAPAPQPTAVSQATVLQQQQQEQVAHETQLQPTVSIHLMLGLYLL